MRTIGLSSLLGGLLLRCITYVYLARGLFAEVLARLLFVLGRYDAPCPLRVEISDGWLERCFWESGVYTQENYRPVCAVELSPSPGNRGLVADSRLVTVQYGEAKSSASASAALPTSLFLKLSGTGVYMRANVIFSGQAREGRFYQLWSEGRWRGSAADSQLGMSSEAVPRVLYARASRLRGEYVMLLENLFDEQRADAAERPRLGANMVFGNQLWGVPEPQRALLDAAVPRVDALCALRASFSTVAGLHAAHWCEPALRSASKADARLGMRNLRATGWYGGGQRASWELGVRRARQGWRAGYTAALAGRWTCSPEMRILMDSALAQASWSRLQAQLQDARVPFALCHGDFHAANAVVELAGPASTAAASTSSFLPPSLGKLILVDWSEFGVWEPTTDIAQMVISDLKVERFDEVREVVREAYYARLCALVRGGEERLAHEWDYDFEGCWRRFVVGGLDRWVWMFGVISGFPQMPAPAIQYFHDQMHAFFVHFAQPLGIEPHQFALKSVALLL
jgi:hypothetical protein